MQAARARPGKAEAEAKKRKIGAKTVTFAQTEVLEDQAGTTCARVAPKKGAHADEGTTGSGTRQKTDNSLKGEGAAKPPPSASEKRLSARGTPRAAGEKPPRNPTSENTEYATTDAPGGLSSVRGKDLGDGSTGDNKRKSTPQKGGAEDEAMPDAGNPPRDRASVDKATLFPHAKHDPGVASDSDDDLRLIDAPVAGGRIDAYEGLAPSLESNEEPEELARQHRQRKLLPVVVAKAVDEPPAEHDSEEETIGELARKARAKEPPALASDTPLADPPATQAKAARAKRTNEEAQTKEIVMESKLVVVKKAPKKGGVCGDEGVCALTEIAKPDPVAPTIAFTGFYDGKLTKEDPDMTPKKKRVVPPSFLPGYEETSTETAPPGEKFHDAHRRTRTSTMFQKSSSFEKKADFESRDGAGSPQLTLKDALLDIGATTHPLGRATDESERSGRTSPALALHPIPMESETANPSKKDGATVDKQHIEQRVTIHNVHNVTLGSVIAQPQAIASSEAGSAESIAAPPPALKSKGTHAAASDETKETTKETAAPQPDAIALAIDNLEPDDIDELFDDLANAMPPVLRDSTIVNTYITSMSTYDAYMLVSRLIDGKMPAATITLLDEESTKLWAYHTPLLAPIASFIRASCFPLAAPLLDIIIKTPKLYLKRITDGEVNDRESLLKLIAIPNAQLCNQYGINYAGEVISGAEKTRPAPPSKHLTTPTDVSRLAQISSPIDDSFASGEGPTIAMKTKADENETLPMKLSPALRDEPGERSGAAMSGACAGNSCTDRRCMTSGEEEAGHLPMHARGRAVHTTTVRGPRVEYVNNGSYMFEYHRTGEVRWER